jgi:hypothetical protein
MWNVSGWESFGEAQSSENKTEPNFAVLYSNACESFLQEDKFRGKSKLSRRQA